LVQCVCSSEAAWWSGRQQERVAGSALTVCGLVLLPVHGLQVPPQGSSSGFLLGDPPRGSSSGFLLKVPPQGSSSGILLKVPPQGSSTRFLLRDPPQGSFSGFLLRVPPQGSSSGFLLALQPHTQSIRWRQLHKDNTFMCRSGCDTKKLLFVTVDILQRVVSRGLTHRGERLSLRRNRTPRGRNVYATP